MNPLFIIAALVALAAALSKRRPGANDKPGEVSGQVAPPEGNLAEVLRDAFNRVILDFGVEVAKNVERVYRLETANFTSGQFKRTNTPGMHAFSATFPFGWSLAADGLTASDFWPTIVMDENAGGTFQWVVFKDLGQAIHYVGYFLNKYDNNPGRWKSTDPTQQARYRDAVAAIEPKIVNNLVTGF